MAEALFSG